MDTEPASEIWADRPDAVEILAAAAELDGRGVPELRPPAGAPAGVAGLRVDEVSSAADRLEAAGMRVLRLAIAPLREPWDAPADPHRRRFKSGCAPVLALERAREALRSGDADAVLIQGEDPLRTGYSRQERRRLMDIWPDVGGSGRPSVPEAYSRLTSAWCARLGLSPAQFEALADALLENYAATARARGLRADLGPLRAVRVTRLLRLGDCANPEVDFRGAALLVPRPGEAAARAADRSPSGRADLRAERGLAGRRVLLAAVATEAVPDGPEHVASLARYGHLRRALVQALAEAGLAPGAGLRGLWEAGTLLLEAYTCFPVVPLAFLVAAGLASPDPDGLAAALRAAPVTVTGGMNLARAPWNNPVLHALAVMWARLRAAPRAAIGLLHGNGGLGGWQGVAVLRAAPTRGEAYTGSKRAWKNRRRLGS